MKFRYHFFEKENVLVIRYFGDIYLEDILESATAVYSDVNYNQNANGISFLQNCTLHLNQEELLKLMTLEDEEPKAILTKWAVIVDNPKSTVASIFYKMMARKHKAEVFSTWEAAANFQSIKLKESDVLELLPL
jgi:hypothetical protein